VPFKFRRVWFTRVTLNAKGKAQFGKPNERMEPWKRGVCVGTSGGVAILLYNGRFMWGMRVMDAKSDQKRMLEMAQLMLKKESRDYILARI